MIDNERGQALLEFVLILPIFLLMMFSFIDLGRIILENNKLESIATISITKYQETNDVDEVKSYLESLGYDVDLSITESNNLLNVKVSSDLSLTLLSNYNHISTERVVSYE